MRATSPTEKERPVSQPGDDPNLSIECLLDFYLFLFFTKYFDAEIFSLMFYENLFVLYERSRLNFSRYMVPLMVVGLL
jgi:hypothetical protein